MITITTEGIEKIRGTFASLIPRVQAQVLADTAQVIFDTAERRVDTHTRTGRLARSLKMEPQGDSAWVIYHDLQHAPYAPFVHWGVRPHAIRPRERKALRWPSGKGTSTGFVFAKWVNHPGYQGDRWLVTGIHEAVRRLDEIARRVKL